MLMLSRLCFPFFLSRALWDSTPRLVGPSVRQPLLTSLAFASFFNHGNRFSFLLVLPLCGCPNVPRTFSITVLAYPLRNRAFRICELILKSFSLGSTLLFSRGHTTLHLAMSVGPSVGPSYF